MNNETYIKAITKSYSRMFGRPGQIVQLRTDSETDQIPTAIDILYYLPASEADPLTTVVTAGMSYLLTPNADTYVELMLVYGKTGNKDDREKWGKELGNLAVAPFRNDFSLSIPMTLSDVKLSLFAEMDAAIILGSDYTEPEFVTVKGEPDREVALARVFPVHNSERLAAQRIGALQVIRQIRRSDYDVTEYDRPPVEIKEE